MEAGADINARNHRGRTPIFSSFRGFRCEVGHLEFLESLGANIFEVDDEEANLRMAFVQSLHKLGDVQNYKRVLERLVRRGVDPLAEDVEGKTTLDVASAKVMTELLELFREV
jgi:hypothetical protein